VALPTGWEQSCRNTDRMKLHLKFMMHDHLCQQTMFNLLPNDPVNCQLIATQARLKWEHIQIFVGTGGDKMKSCCMGEDATLDGDRWRWKCVHGLGWV